ncbi:hypothetical protein JL722_2914 [Aureococcus anophagefferens]|nr:hypothetical protein JL722_2914 [Aureococcus anophagefferens]
MLGAQGCGKSPPVATGRTVVRHVEVEGAAPLPVAHPASYDASKPTPLILSHGGWTVSAEEDEHDSGLSELAEEAGYVVAYAQGWADNPHPAASTGTGDAVGTVERPAKPGCYAWGGTSQYCYVVRRADGGALRRLRQDGLRLDGVASTRRPSTSPCWICWRTGCVDVTREYATGQSNGAIYSFRLGVELAGRLAAIAPISGSFMNGYIDAPAVPVPVLDCTGTHDVTVPINDTTYGDGPVSNEGWIYSLMSDIFAVWEPANGCEDEPASQWKTPQDGVDERYCWGKTCGGNPVVRCAWNGAHNYFGNEGSKNSRLVWNFVSRFTKESHLGRGEVDASSESRFSEGLVSSARPAAAALAVEREIAEAEPARAARPRASGDPRSAAADGTRRFGADGRVCAPAKTGRSGAPTCAVGGYRNVGTDFHCVLTCDRAMSATAKDPEADAACPRAAASSATRASSTRASASTSRGAGRRSRRRCPAHGQAVPRRWHNQLDPAVSKAPFTVDEGGPKSAGAAPAPAFDLSGPLLEKALAACVGGASSPAPSGRAKAPPGAPAPAGRRARGRRGVGVGRGTIAAGGAAGRSRRWTADEAQRFGELMARSRKDVARVARELGCGRTVGGVLAFYYGKWKQTDAYKALKAQMRADRAGAPAPSARELRTRASARRARRGRRRRPRAAASAPRAARGRPPRHVRGADVGRPAAGAAVGASAAPFVAEPPGDGGGDDDDGLELAVRWPPPELYGDPAVRGSLVTFDEHDWYVCRGGETVEAVARAFEFSPEVRTAAGERKSFPADDKPPLAPAVSASALGDGSAPAPALRPRDAPEAGVMLLLPSTTRLSEPPAHKLVEGAVVCHDDRRWYVTREAESVDDVAAAASCGRKFDDVAAARR